MTANIEWTGNSGETLDAKEAEKYIDEFGTDIYRFCLKLCTRKTEAENLYQQTFLKALKSIWSLASEKNPKALLFSPPTIFGKVKGVHLHSQRNHSKSS